MSSGAQGRVAYRLKRAEQALRGVIDEALATHGITSSQYGALSALAAAPGTTSSELARACLVSAQSMHELMRVLIDLGFVDRVRRDGRSLQLKVTPAGQELLRTTDPVVDGIERTMLGPSTDRTQLEELLDALIARLTETPTATR